MKKADVALANKVIRAETLKIYPTVVDTVQEGAGTGGKFAVDLKIKDEQYHFDTEASKEVVQTDEAAAPSQPLKQVTWFPFVINSETEAFKYAQENRSTAVRLVKKERTLEILLRVPGGEKNCKIVTRFPYLTNSQDIPLGAPLHA